MRNYGFTHANPNRTDPWTPYHDLTKPWGNQRFSSTGFPSPNKVESFLSEEPLSRWERDGDFIILYGHLAWGYYADGSVHEGFARAPRRLAERDGWFSPVATVLDLVHEQRGEHVLTTRQGLALELRWALGMGRKPLRTTLRRIITRR